MAKEIVKKRQKNPFLKKILDDVEEEHKKDEKEAAIKRKFKKINQKKRLKKRASDPRYKEDQKGYRLSIYMQKHLRAELNEKVKEANVSMTGAITAGCKLWLERSRADRQALAMGCMIRARAFRPPDKSAWAEPLKAKPGRKPGKKAR